MSITRRTFVQSAVVAGSALVLPARSYSRIIGSSSRLRLGVIGLNGRGKDHISGFGDQVAAVCDCDQAVLDKISTGPEVQRFTDYRLLCESKDIDAISIATPNHTHALLAVTALANGKHVFVEKPVSHNVREGRQLADAAARTGLICQCGTQARSSTCLQQAVQFVRDGGLGRISHVIGTCYKPRKSIGKLAAPMKIPPSIDYDLWCGPAEKRELFRPQLHYDWHWDFNTGNGDMGNQGIHQMDIGRWFLGESAISPRVLSVGGRLGYNDAGNTPNSQVVLHDYPAAPLIFETRGLPRSAEFHDPELWDRNMDDYRGAKIGVVVHCANGYVVVTNYSKVTAYDHDGNEVQVWEGDGAHYQNFLDAVTAGDAGKLAAPVVEGHVSSALCHTGNISHVLGEPASGAGILSRLESENELFRDSVQRLLGHLAANEVDTDGDGLIFGADVRFDPANERATGNERAERLLTRDYRAGFEIPAV